MWNLILIILISLLPLIVTWITSPSEIFVEDGNLSKTRKEIFKRTISRRLSIRGWFFIGTFLMTAVFVVLQYRSQKNAEKEAERKLQIKDSLNKVEQGKRDTSFSKEQDRRDSISYTRLRDSKNETVEALAKYGLKYDSAQKRIEKLIKDSTGKTVNNIQEIIPFFGLKIPVESEKFNSIHIAKVSPLKDSLYLKFSCRDNTCFNVNLNMAYVITRGAKSFFKTIYLIRNTTTPKDGILNTYTEINPPFDLFDNKIYFYFFGTYTNANSKTTFYISELYQYDSTNEVYIVMDSQRESTVLNYLTTQSPLIKQFLSEKR
ncbi:MAG: hypothetical protein HYR66_07530 [Sphingobacteriales bacterium]|nr:hypothetical protein [Sphingobacteriales bacterium]MBI3718412.1 hypothetical protein [Sphingobacteriales bacterium]